MGRGGFEPPKVKTDRFTVCCHWQIGNLSIWSWRLESNPQPADYKSAALPVELRQHNSYGASGRNRTTDTGIFSPLLYRLSYRGICYRLQKALATRMGLEPTTSSVTGWRSNQLNYRAMAIFLIVYINGGPSGTRTPDQSVMSRPL